MDRGELHAYIQRDGSQVDKASGTFTATRPEGRLICRDLGSTLSPVTLSGKPTMRVDAAFSADADGYYFGLDQHQNTLVDLRGFKLPVWHKYNGPGANRQVVGFPFLVSTHNYAIL
jgi:hypothetical protein